MYHRIIYTHRCDVNVSPSSFAHLFKTVEAYEATNNFFHDANFPLSHSQFCYWNQPGSGRKNFATRLHHLGSLIRLILHSRDIIKAHTRLYHEKKSWNSLKNFYSTWTSTLNYFEQNFCSFFSRVFASSSSRSSSENSFEKTLLHICWQGSSLISISNV